MKPKKGDIFITEMGSMTVFTTRNTYDLVVWNGDIRTQDTWDESMRMGELIGNINDIRPEYEPKTEFVTIIMGPNEDVCRQLWDMLTKGRGGAA